MPLRRWLARLMPRALAGTEPVERIGERVWPRRRIATGAYIVEGRTFDTAGDARAGWISKPQVRLDAEAATLCRWLAIASSEGVAARPSTLPTTTIWLRRDGSDGRAETWTIGDSRGLVRLTRRDLDALIVVLEREAASAGT